MLEYCFYILKLKYSNAGLLIYISETIKIYHLQINLVN